MKEYYDRRAPEYDDWWLGRGLFADRDRPGWEAELDQVAARLAALAAGANPRHRVRHRVHHASSARSGRRHRPERVDDRDRRRRLPEAEFVVGDALALPFPDASFERVHASFFYCHLEEPERLRFLSEARRVAPELIVFGSRAEPDEPLERWEERVLDRRLSVAGVQAGVRAGDAGGRARRQGAPPGALVRGRPLGAVSYRSIATLKARPVARAAPARRRATRSSRCR